MSGSIPAHNAILSSPWPYVVSISLDSCTTIPCMFCNLVGCHYIESGVTFMHIQKCARDSTHMQICTLASKQTQHRGTHTHRMHHVVCFRELSSQPIVNLSSTYRYALLCLNTDNILNDTSCLRKPI